jgi:hypothetical protein
MTLVLNGTLNKLAPAPGIIYRSDYLGEYITLSVIQENNKQSEIKEWVENTINNTKHNKIACVLGNGRSREGIDTTIFTRHRGGHLGKRKMQVYGCNAIYREADVDFIVCTNPVLIKEMVKTYNYAPKNVVLTNTENIIKWKGRFHLYPFYTHMNAGALALKLACFDGHKTVYMMGFDNLPVGDNSSNIYAGTLGYDAADVKFDVSKWETYTYNVMKFYSDVDFCLVEPRSTAIVIPKIYNQLRNFRTIGWRNFAIESDL